MSELQRERTPGIVRKWAEQLPYWIEVREIADRPSEHELVGLDRGEWEAIQLAKEIKANLLLIDERAGVRVARRQGFTVTGRWVFWLKPLDQTSFLSRRRWHASQKRIFAGPRIYSPRRRIWFVDPERNRPIKLM